MKSQVERPDGWYLLIEPNGLAAGRLHVGRFAEAICKHGVGHHKGIHGCDGCCVTCPEEIWSKVTEDT